MPEFERFFKRDKLFNHFSEYAFNPYSAVTLKSNKQKLKRKSKKLLANLNIHT
ncbi:hypothetical protein CHCC20335_4107 [Bacillus paralicheniformis]|nr:hypothetical protein CHCC20335_4107 [Bacillus paralicheniformis]